MRIIIVSTDCSALSSWVKDAHIYHAGFLQLFVRSACLHASDQSKVETVRLKKKKKKEAISIGSCRVHSPFDISDMHSTFVNSYATTFQHLVYPQVRSGEENVRIISFVGDNPTRISIYRHIPCEYSNFKLDSVQYYCAETVQQCTWKDRKKKIVPQL